MTLTRRVLLAGTAAVCCLTLGAAARDEPFDDGSFFDDGSGWTD